jgi:Tol biopolymer transport system component
MPQIEQLQTALEGRYTIERLVGEGGMATVYLARDLRHRRNVALKVLRPDLGAVLGLERFTSEIEVTANLQHPNLLPLFDSGAAGELLFYVMPFVEGESLRARLDREKQLPIDEAIRLATAVAGALDYAHRHGVIHRDLKPENIMLHEGQPLVADFGIALAVSNAGGNRITQTGLSLGTPQYMSPEQATGDRVMDGRTDVYSLGAVTYEMLTGEPPHTGTTSQAVIARVLTERPRPIRSSRPSVPEHVEAAVERALEKLPADRWGTPKEFAEALSGARIVTRATTTSRAAQPSAGSRPTARELAAWILAAAGLGAAAFLALKSERPVAPPMPAEFELVMPDSVDPSPVGGAATVAVSRDGSTLVFQARARAGAPPSLWLRRLDDRTVQQIRGTDSARAPVLSPDGTELLFVAGLGSSTPVKRIALRGGTPRTVVDSAPGNGQVSWGDAGLMVTTLRNSLWTVPEEGGPRTLLAAPDSSRGHMRYGFPEVLPGGKAALMVIWKGADLESVSLGVVSIPDGAVTELGIQGAFPRYSATGHLLYVTGDAVLTAVPFDLESRRTLGRAFPVAEGVRLGSGAAAAYGVGGTGTIAFLGGGVRVTALRTLVAVGRDGAERPLEARPGYFWVPRISPDGKQIAMMIGTAGTFGLDNPDVWRLDLGSNTLTRVTTDSSSTRPVWTPDGERIAFLRASGDSVIRWRPLYATGQTTTLLGLPAGDVSDVDIVGGYVAMRLQAGTNGSADIWLVHRDSLDSPRPFLTEAYTELSPRISPDGRLLAYVTNRTGSNEVYVRPIAGSGGELQVSTDGGTEPVWSREGSELFYRVSRRLMSATIARAPRLSVARRDSLFADPYVRANVAGNYDVFPGGREFLMVRPNQQDSGIPPLTVRLNWHGAARSDARMGQP